MAPDATDAAVQSDAHGKPAVPPLVSAAIILGLGFVILYLVPRPAEVTI